MLGCLWLNGICLNSLANETSDNSFNSLTPIKNKNNDTRRNILTV